MAAIAASQEKLGQLSCWLKLHPITLIATCIFLSYLISYLRDSNSIWFELSQPAAKLLLEGGNIYHTTLAFAYPPSRAMFFTPFLTLPDWGQLVAWWACNVICLVLICR